MKRYQDADRRRMGRRRGARDLRDGKSLSRRGLGAWCRARNAADVDRAVEAARKAFRAPLGAKISATRARRAAAQARRSHRRRGRPARRDRDARQRQADHRDARAAALHPAMVPLFRRPRGQDRGPRHPDRQARHDQLHARRAARRRRGDHAVELAADAGRPGSSRPRWPPATRWSGSRRNSRPSRRSNSDACSRRPASRRASSTS